MFASKIIASDTHTSSHNVSLSQINASRYRSENRSTLPISFWIRGCIACTVVASLEIKKWALGLVGQEKSPEKSLCSVSPFPGTGVPIEITRSISARMRTYTDVPLGPCARERRNSRILLAATTVDGRAHAHLPPSGSRRRSRANRYYGINRERRYWAHAGRA